MDTPEDRDYIFFFKFKTRPNQRNLDRDRKQSVQNIPEDGISAKKLAQKTELSLRRTYKYLRGLKGKKLIFARKTPKTYALTEKGERLAWLLNEVTQAG